MCSCLEDKLWKNLPIICHSQPFIKKTTTRITFIKYEFLYPCHRGQVYLANGYSQTKYGWTGGKILINLERLSRQSKETRYLMIQDTREEKDD